MKRMGAVLLAAFWSLAPAPVAAAIVVLDDGRDVVIDAASSFPADSVYVQNVGCDATVELPCPLPWGDPTSVEVVEGGAVGGDLRAFESSRVTLSGGAVGGQLLAEDASRVTLTGGVVGAFLLARGASRVTLSGGAVTRQLLAEDAAHVTLTGGSVGGFLWAVESSQVTVSGGAIGGGLYAYTDSRVTLRGGSVGRFVGAYDSASVTLVGTGFAVDGVPVGFGPIAATSGLLTGTLAAGEPLDNAFCHLGGECFAGSPATGLITLVPEPDAALLFPVAVLGLATLHGRRPTLRPRSPILRPHGGAGTST